MLSSGDLSQSTHNIWGITQDLFSMAGKDLRAQLEQVKELSGQEEEAGYRDLALGDHPNDADSLKVKEEAIQKLTETKVKQKDAQGLKQLLTDLRKLFEKLPKAKTAKIVRNLIDAIAKVPNSTALQVNFPDHQFVKLSHWSLQNSSSDICWKSIQILDAQ